MPNMILHSPVVVVSWSTHDRLILQDNFPVVKLNGHIEVDYELTPPLGHDADNNRFTTMENNATCAPHATNGTRGFTALVARAT